MPLTGEEREKRYGGGEGSCRFLAPSTTNAFRSSSRKPCLRQTVRNSTISQDLASTLRGGSGGEAHPGLGSILCCSQGSALHRCWFPPRAGKSDGCSAAGVSSVWVKPGNRNLKYLERRELVPRARGVLRRQQGLEQGLDYLPGLGTEEWGELACSAGAGPVGAMEHMPWRKTLDFPFFPASHWLNPAGCLGSQARRSQSPSPGPSPDPGRNQPESGGFVGGNGKGGERWDWRPLWAGALEPWGPFKGL